MKLRTCLKFAFVILFLQMFVVNSQDDEEESDEDRPRSCQKYLFDFVYGITQSILKCLGGKSTFKLNNIFELTTRASCLLKCTLQEEGIVSMEGTLDDIGAAFYFEETFAEEVREIALPEAQQCFALADDFQPKEYWCKSYLPFIECSFKAILKGLIPYGGDCVASPTLGILFAVIKNLAPNSPSMAETGEELKRVLGVANKPIKCFDKNCTRLYEYKKVNGSQAVVLYDKDMNVVSVETRKNKPKPKEVSPDNSMYQFNSFNPTSSSSSSYKNYNYNGGYTGNNNYSFNLGKT